MTDEHMIEKRCEEHGVLVTTCQTWRHHIPNPQEAELGRLREDLERFAMQIATDRELLDKKDDELARLREQLVIDTNVLTKLRDRLRVYEGDDHNDGRDPYIRDLKAELARLREALEDQTNRADALENLARITREDSEAELARLREERDAAVNALIGQARRQYREALDALRGTKWRPNGNSGGPR